jgi:hypothetical protein
VHTGLWYGNLREREHLDGPSIEGRYYYSGSSGGGLRGHRMVLSG